MCSAQQNPPRTVPGVNPETIVLYTARSTPAKTLGAPLSGRVTFWARDCLLLWLSLIPRSQKSWFNFFILPSPFFPVSLLRLFWSTKGWPCLCIPGPRVKSWEAPSKDLKGDIAGTKVYGFLHVQSAWWLTPQRQFRVSQCGVWEDTLHVFWTCAICEVHSSTKGLLISKVRGLWLLAWGWGDDRGLRTWGFGFRIWSLDWKIVYSFPVISKHKTFLESKSQWSGAGRGADSVLVQALCAT